MTLECKPTEPETLFARLAEVVSDAGFMLNQINMTKHPTREGQLINTDYQVRSRPYAERMAQQDQ